MLIHPWDAPEDTRWQSWLAGQELGQLIAAGRGRELPVLTPLPFHYEGGSTIWVHLARPNPIWPALEENPRALLAVTGEHTYIPADWNADDEPELGVPTEYYAAVHLECDARVIDDPDEKAELLNRQLRQFEPAGGRLPVSTNTLSDKRLLPGIRGIELTITEVRAKFKFGGNKPAAQRAQIADHLSTRATPRDLTSLPHLLDSP
ncbi:FMN-binding negative transcriptional regulator [Amycolatopsis nigrescens]|uniref:FMN-binding negative transcriptional regulator n=1 Tax=Amycolatopsis nigrescens TaxID=381445 RepID=UPI00035ED552|nr:FMN-binding negative transcriptional regulator [Amycolatopsis nigrescens]